MTVDINIWNEAEEYTIIGIRQNSDTSMINMLMGDIINVELPISAAGSSFGINIDTFEQLTIVVDGVENSNQVARDALKFLENSL